MKRLVERFGSVTAAVAAFLLLGATLLPFAIGRAEPSTTRLKGEALVVRVHFDEQVFLRAPRWEEVRTHFELSDRQFAATLAANATGPGDCPRLTNPAPRDLLIALSGEPAFQCPVR